MIIDAIFLGKVQENYELRNKFAYVVNGPTGTGRDVRNTVMHLGRETVFRVPLYKYKLIEKIGTSSREQIVITTIPISLSTFLAESGDQVPMHMIASKMNGDWQLNSHQISTLQVLNGDPSSMTIAQYGIEKLRREFTKYGAEYGFVADEYFRSTSHAWSEYNLGLNLKSANVYNVALDTQSTNEAGACMCLDEVHNILDAESIFEACCHCDSCNFESIAPAIIYNWDCLHDILHSVVGKEELAPQQVTPTHQRMVEMRCIPTSHDLSIDTIPTYSYGVFRTYQTMHPPKRLPLSSETSDGQLPAYISPDQDCALISLGVFLMNQPASDIEFTIDMVYCSLEIKTFNSYIQVDGGVACTFDIGDLQQAMFKCIMNFGIPTGVVRYATILKNYHEEMFVKFFFNDDTPPLSYRLDLIAALLVSKCLILA